VPLHSVFSEFAIILLRAEMQNAFPIIFSERCAA